jgi:hypothetical protein
MQASDKRRFKDLLTDVLSYYGKDASTFVIDLWWNSCQQYDFEQVSKALSRHAQDPEHGHFAPKVADVVRVLSGTITDRSVLAWGKVLEAMSSVGAYQDVVFDDPAIHAAIEDCGGWTKVCRTPSEDLSYLQHRFGNSYKAYAGLGVFPYQRRLVGDRSPDGEYEKKGLPLPKPVLVGDVEKCHRVYAIGSTGGKVQITHAASHIPQLLLETSE